MEENLTLLRKKRLFPLLGSIILLALVTTDWFMFVGEKRIYLVGLLFLFSIIHLYQLVFVDKEVGKITLDKDGFVYYLGKNNPGYSYSWDDISVFWYVVAKRSDILVFDVVHPLTRKKLDTKYFHLGGGYGMSSKKLVELLNQWLVKYSTKNRSLEEVENLSKQMNITGWHVVLLIILMLGLVLVSNLVVKP